MATLKPSPASSASPSATTPSSTHATVQKSYSCVLCAQRKVKCDKSPGGCSNCTKARVPCIYKAPAPPRRRKRGMREMDTNTRIKLYEEALRKLGVDPADIERENFNPSRRGSVVDSLLGEGTLFEDHREDCEQVESDAGLLVSEEGKSRYLENNLWTSLRGEFRDTKDILQESSDEEKFEETDGSTPELFSDGGSLLFGSPKSSRNIRNLHPQPVQIFKLWQTFLDNVHPLVKVFHTPTIQQTILNASGNLDDVSRHVEALMFAIYCAATASLSDPECMAIMDESKASVTRRFRSGAQQALINANFLKSSEIMALQAFVLFLLSLSSHDPRTLWILTGVAGRIGQRTGLHRDGDTLGLPPFESEMRRRLWWQIILLDGFSEKLAGTGSSISFFGDTKMAGNFNDSDLFPGMKELPKEHDGATEMMFFLIRCHVGEFLRRTSPKGTFDGVWNRLSGSSATVASKDKAIDEFESALERKFLRYCDESIPWHFMCAYLGRAVVCTMRFIAHSPEQYRDKGLNMPQKEKDLLFTNCLRVISYQNLAYTSKKTQGFIWHVNMHFQWKAFIYMLSELRYRTQATDADEAWKQVRMVYEFHPNFAHEVSKRALPVAVGNLTLKAWDAYAIDRNLRANEPYFIQMLRTQRAKTPPSAPSEASLPTPSQPIDNPPLENKEINFSSVEFEQAFDPLHWGQDFVTSLEVPSSFDQNYLANMPPLDPDNMDWTQWDNLLQDFQSQGTSMGGIQGSGFGFGNR